MRPLVILPTPSFGLRVKREQPSYGQLPPNAHLLGFDAKFSEKTRWCISRVDSWDLCTKSLNAVCATGQGSGTKLPVELFDLISAGELPNPLGLFPLGLVPADSLGANEAAATPRP